MNIKNDKRKSKRMKMRILKKRKKRKKMQIIIMKKGLKMTVKVLVKMERKRKEEINRKEDAAILNCQTKSLVRAIILKVLSQIQMVCLRKSLLF